MSESPSPSLGAVCNGAALDDFAEPAVNDKPNGSLVAEGLAPMGWTTGGLWPCRRMLVEGGGPAAWASR